MHHWCINDATVALWLLPVTHGYVQVTTYTFAQQRRQPGMSSQDSATPLTGADRPSEMLCSLAVAVLTEHTDAAGLCAVCGCAWPCELVVLADHNLAAL